ncbi:MAG: TRAP transporter substrate-binding protein, partial [Planctomycetota bacterium]
MRATKVMLTALLAVGMLVTLADDAAAQRRRRRGGGEQMKVATLAPEGTSWTKVLNDLDKDLKKETSDALSLRVYAGGVQGDEKVVLRKMKLGQIHGAGFTGTGLGEIVPWVRLLELPFTYKSSEEVDYVRSKIDERLRADFAKEGFVIIGWIDVGFAYMYSPKEINTIEGLRGAKPWLWEGDPLGEAAFNEVGVKPTPLALPDVLQSLSTKLIDTCYTSPMACLGLQWFSRVEFVNDVPLAHGTGGLLVQKAYFDKLPQEQQAALLKYGDEHGKRLTVISREENVDAAKTLAERGIKSVPYTEEDKAKLDAIGKTVAQSLVGQLYTQEQL